MEIGSSVGYTEPIEKYLLLLLYAKGPTKSMEEPIRGDIWLQKELFLVSRNVDELREEFDSYLLGPFSEAVYEYEEQLKVSDYIQQDREGLKLTEKGRQIASKLWETTDEKERQMIVDVKSLLNDLSRIEILVFIYQAFEGFTDNSVIKEEVERNRLPVAISLFRKRKVSLERASEIANIPVQKFISILQEKGIPAFDYADSELVEEMRSSETSCS